MSTRPHATRLAILGLHAIAILLWGLHLYAYRMPPSATAIPEAGSDEAAWWGLWPITYLPSWSVWLATALLVATIAASWLSLRDKKQRVAAGRQSVQSKHFLALALLSLLLGSAFFTFPIVHTRWGDAYMISRAMAWPDPLLRLTHSWQAPLDVFLHSQLWLSLHESKQWEEATPVYRILSPAAGVLYLSVVLALSREGTLAPGWLTFGLLSSLGSLQLFFGYVENYSFATVGVLAYLWLALGVLRGERPLWMAASVLALTNATHPSTIVLAPSLLYCGWRWIWQQNQRPAWRTAVLQIALPMVVVAAATVLLMEAGDHGVAALFTSDRPGGGDARLFVPLFTPSTRWEHYTLFSWLHLRDFLNEQLLVAPVVLITLAWIGWRKRAWAKEPVPFLTLAAVCYLLFTWVWNPDYGGQRDWDLFSLAALPTTLLLIAILPRVLPDRQQLAAGVMPLLVVQIAHTTAWIYQNTLPWAWP